MDVVREGTEYMQITKLEAQEVLRHSRTTGREPLRHEVHAHACVAHVVAHDLAWLLLSPLSR